VCFIPILLLQLYGGTETVQITLLWELQRLLPNRSTGCPQQGHAGRKTLYQQNPPVLSWRCRPTQVDLRNGRKTGGRLGWLVLLSQLRSVSWRLKRYITLYWSTTAHRDWTSIVLETLDITCCSPTSARFAMFVDERAKTFWERVWCKGCFRSSPTYYTDSLGNTWKHIYLGPRNRSALWLSDFYLPTFFNNNHNNSFFS